MDFDHELAGPGMQEVLVTLARNLELENEALLRGDEAILVAVDHGDRLVEMQSRLRDAVASGTTVTAHYQFDSIDVSLLVPFGAQTGLSLGLAGRGTMVEEVARRRRNRGQLSVGAVRADLRDAASDGRALDERGGAAG